MQEEAEIVLTGGGRTPVVKKGSIVHRKAAPWSPSVHALLRHLEKVGFTGAPSVIGAGFDESGRETLSFIEGNFINPAPWNDDAFSSLGTLLRQLHDAASNFQTPADAVWRPCPARSFRGNFPVFGHGDLGPWNIVARQGLPVAFIDWENAGPTDAVSELAQLCWLNVQLCDDDIAERVGLPSAKHRAQQMRYIVDAYGLPHAARMNIVDIMIRFAILDAADQAIEANVNPDSKDIEPLWALAWRTRSAAWMVRNQDLLNQVLLK